TEAARFEQRDAEEGPGLRVVGLERRSLAQERDRGLVLFLVDQGPCRREARLDRVRLDQKRPPRAGLGFIVILVLERRPCAVDQLLAGHAHRPIPHWTPPAPFARRHAAPRAAGQAERWTPSGGVYRPRFYDVRRRFQR